MGWVLKYGPRLGHGLIPSQKVKLRPSKGLQRAFKGPSNVLIKMLRLSEHSIGQAQAYLRLGSFFRCRAPGLPKNKGHREGLDPNPSLAPATLNVLLQV